jgi:hypothetical protein
MEAEMFKDELLKAVKVAAEAYNGGMSADNAVAKAAIGADFNEKQAERLVEMFNTSATLSQEKSASDPTGSCELADKDKVAKIMLSDDGSMGKSASSVDDIDYSFYGIEPGRTSKARDARRSGIDNLVKAASASTGVPDEPEELGVSRNSMYLIINRDIDMLKQASEAAMEIAGALSREAEQGIYKIAKFADSDICSEDMLNMMRLSMPSDVVEKVAEFSPRFSRCDGGRFSKLSVYDDSSVSGVVKAACDISENINKAREYEQKMRFYMKKAEESKSRMRDILGIQPSRREKSASISDMFSAPRKMGTGECDGDSVSDEVDMALRVRDLMKKASISPDEVSRVMGDIEKEAGKTTLLFSPNDALEALSWSPSSGGAQKRIINVRRAMILSELMTNDPIISEASPADVVDAYKTMIMTSPRVSLDKSQVRAFLRSAVNSVAISPNDAKVLADVDKGTRISNIDRLTSIDSSVKDSNEWV